MASQDIPRRSGEGGGGGASGRGVVPAKGPRGREPERPPPGHVLWDGGDGLVLGPRGPILVRTQPQKGGGGTPPPPPALQTPKWLYGTMGFVVAGDFVLGIRQGEIFLFDPMCLYS